MTSSTFSFLFSLSPFLFSFPIFFSHLFLSYRSLLYSSIFSFLFFPSIPFLLLLFPSVFRFLFSSWKGFSSLSLKMGVLHEPCCSEISEVLCFLSYYFCMSYPVKNYYSYCMEKTEMFRKFTKKIFFYTWICRRSWNFAKIVPQPPWIFHWFSREQFLKFLWLSTLF